MEFLKAYYRLLMDVCSSLCVCVWFITLVGVHLMLQTWCRLCPDPGLSAGGAGLVEDRHQRLQRRKWKQVQPGAGGRLHVRRSNPAQEPPLEEERLLQLAPPQTLWGTRVVVDCAKKKGNIMMIAFILFFTIVILKMSTFYFSVAFSQICCGNDMFTAAHADVHK
jgi:hypothetical protein